MMKKIFLNMSIAYFLYLVMNLLMMIFTIFIGYMLISLGFGGIMIFALGYVGYMIVCVMIGFKLLKITKNAVVDFISINILNVIVTPLICFLGIYLTEEFSLPFFRWICGLTDFDFLKVFSIVVPFVFMWLGMQIKRKKIKS